MTQQDLGFNKKLEGYRNEQNIDSFDVGRIILEHKDRYVVKTETQELGMVNVSSKTYII
ncbi:hypothetical protein SAMN06265377_3288 [Flagellimonas pacifica]|uniref:Uncharacterized protein n=1 Tax=Flagellimonas pacifica TaxID=1247520 RepID=A0A285MW76_9FLAO|nr:hypothetical protein SAMN06265377_3288 [Allomuricauda parva]